MEERRRKSRFRLDPPLCVINPDTGDELGFAVDITPQGVQLTAPEKTYAIGRDEDIYILLTRPMFARQSIEVSGKCVWAKPADDSAMHCFGFSFTQVAPEMVGIIVSLIQEEDETY